MSGSVEHGAQPDTVVQRAYCCKHCGVQCRRPQDLRRHLLVHTDASFSCERCGHKFTRYDTLTRHKRDNCHGYTTDARPTPQQMQQIGSDMSDSGDMASPDAYYASNGGIQQQIQATAEMSVETSPTSRVPSQPHIAPHQPDTGPSQAPQPTGMPIPPPVAPPAHAHAHAHTHHPPPPQQHAPPPHQQAPQMLPSLPHAPGMASVPQLSPLQGQSNGIAAQMLSFSPPGTQQAGQPVGGVPPPVQVSQVSSMPVPSAPHMNSVPQVQHVSPPQVPPVPMPPAQLVPPAHMTSGATAYLPQVVPFPSQPSKSSPTDPPVIDSSRGLKPEPWRNNQPMEPNPIGLPPLFQPLRTLRHHSDAELEVQRQRFDSKLTLQISELEDALHKIHSVVGSLDSRMGHIESRLSHLESHLSPSPAASAPPQLQQQLQQQQQQPQQQQQLQPPPAAPQLANGDAHAPTT